jgi:hypothetical protein
MKKTTKGKSPQRGAFIYRKCRRSLSAGFVSIHYGLAMFLLEQFTLSEPKRDDEHLEEGHPLLAIGDSLQRRVRIYELDPKDVVAKTRAILVNKKYEGARKALVNENRKTLVELRKLALRTIKAEEENLFFGWKKR